MISYEVNLGGEWGGDGGGEGEDHFRILERPYLTFLTILLDNLLDLKAFPHSVPYLTPYFTP